MNHTLNSTLNMDLRPLSFWISAALICGEWCYRGTSRVGYFGALWYSFIPLAHVIVFAIGVIAYVFVETVWIAYYVLLTYKNNSQYIACLRRYPVHKENSHILYIELKSVIIFFCIEFWKRKYLHRTLCFIFVNRYF